MGFDSKDREILVNDVIERLAETLPENVDYSDGQVLRSIIEAFMQEVDVQYWQLQQIYFSAYVDDAFDEDLDKVVAILGIIRTPASKAIGNVIFSRATNATSDFFIPSGTLVETLPDSNGIIVQFQTTTDATLLTGTKEITVPIECTVEGTIGNISIGSIKTINTPSMGIEAVRNDTATTDGDDIEADELLRDRAKHALESNGLGTVEAIKFQLLNISGLKQVDVLDMSRGIGTADALVLGETTPMSQVKKDEIIAVITAVKAGGIDVQLVEPTIITVNINVTLTIKDTYTVNDVYNDAEKAIVDYISTLGIGQKLILNQLERSILNSNEYILDIVSNSPNTNITINTQEFIKLGTITIQ